MTPEKERFLDELIEQLTEDTRTKFILGDKEHGHKGAIWDIPVEKLLGETLNEAIDQYVYLYTLKKSLPNLIKYCKQLEEENAALRAMGLTLE